MRPIDADALKKRISEASWDWEKDFPHLASMEKAVTQAFMLDIDEEPTVVTPDMEKAKSILDELLNAGWHGADPDSWKNGYNHGVFFAIRTVERITGVSIDEVLE